MHTLTSSHSAQRSGWLSLSGYSVIALVILAISVRALIPVGFMPDLASLAIGKIEMVVCTMDGPVTIQVDAGFDPHPQKHDTTSTTDHSMVCAFAVMAHGMVPHSDALDFLYVLLSAAAIHFTLLSYQYVRRRYHSPAQPRGPPVFSC